MKKRFLLFVLVLALAAVLLSACGSKTQTIDLGTSGFSVTVDGSVRRLRRERIPDGWRKNGTWDGLK